MGLNKFYLFFLLLFTCYVSAEEILIKEKIVFIIMKTEKISYYLIKKTIVLIKMLFQ